MTPTNPIPEGMKAWHGGDSAPEDWRWPSDVQLRRGDIVHGMPDNDLRWKHATGDGHMEDIIAYTPKPTPPVGDSAAERARECFDATRPIGGLFWTELPEHEQQRLTRMLAFASQKATHEPKRQRAEPSPVDDELTRTFIEGWNATIDHDDFDMALHFWMLSHATIMAPAEREAAQVGADTALDVLADLSSYVGAGIGDESTTPEQYGERIRWGIDHLCSAASQKGNSDA